MEETYGKLDLKVPDMEMQGLMTNVKDGFFTKTNELTSQVTKVIDSGTNYYAFGAFLMVGCLFLLLSLTFLPLILIAPNKFNLFFSLGSFFIQLSMAFFHGPLKYMQMIFKKENMIISLLYVGSLLFALYSSMIWGTYLSAILVVFLQVSYSNLTKYNRYFH